MEPKKISFGFSKLTKKTNIISTNVQQEKKKVQLIDCLEGQSIKIKDAVEVEEKPLIIPIKDDKKNLLDRIRDAKKQVKKPAKGEIEEDNRPDSELTVDELAARQLLREAKARLENQKKGDSNKVAVLPLNQDQPSLEGEKESTLEDYESIPINDYGLALLRGMGWEKGMAIGKNVSKIVPVQIPELKPKGLGLGATKQVQAEIPAKKAVDKDGKELSLVKNAFAKIIGGTHKGNYCEVQGFDEEAGRVIIKMCPKGEIVNLNEFMLVPVTKEEFSKGSKVLNNAKYEEYKEISDKKIKTQRSEQRNIKEESSDEEDKNTSFSKKYDNYHGRSSSKNKSKDKKNKHKSDSSESDSEPKSSKSRHRHRSNSKDKRKKDRYRDRSDSLSDIEYYKKNKKNSKHTKSKYKDRSRSRSKSRDRYRRNKKIQRHDSSDSDHKSRKNSRHRRNSSSSGDDRRKYRNKK